MSINLTFNPFTGTFDTTLPITPTAVGSSPNANGLSVTSDNTLTLEPADASNPGLVSTTTQSFTGQKTFVTGLTGTVTGHASLDIASTEKGAVNGVATLDGAGHIPLSQLPPTIVEYQGTWDASTNTPTLSNASGIYNISGFFFIVSTAGTVNFGAGNIVFNTGDWVLFNGTIWERAVQSNVVQSVNGQTGVVTVNAINQLTGDATAGPASGSQSQALTLATVNSNVGSFGTADNVSTVTVNGKGLVTAVSNIPIQITEGQVTNLVTDLAGKQTTGNYITALTGDVTAAGPGSSAATLATVNGNVGTFGSSTSIPTFTVNGKGLVTAANGNVVIAPAGTLTGTTLNSTVVSSSLTSVGTITSGTWTGTTVAVANGGTGVTSVTTTPTVTNFAGWDTNKNLEANSHISDLTTTTTAAGTTTLTVSSTQFQQFTGTTTQTVVLPNATTLKVGQSFYITNRSTGAVTVNANGGGLIQNMIAGSQTIVTVITIGTTAGTWDSQYSITNASASVVPTIQKFTSGTAATYTTPANVKYIRVRMVGGGGGGAGGGTAAGTAAGSGGASTFQVTAGPALLSAGGGTAGTINAPGGAGGTSSLGTGPIGTALSGGSGGDPGADTQGAQAGGGGGGNGAFGGGARGSGGTNAATGGNGSTNTGGGGGGAGAFGALQFGGGGGGSGGFIDAIIGSPAATYTYTVGASGTAGGAGAAGQAGGAGAAGYIEVTEYY